MFGGFAAACPGRDVVAAAQRYTLSMTSDLRHNANVSESRPTSTKPQAVVIGDPRSQKQPRSHRAVAVGAGASGAMAVGAMALGALAVGAVAIGALAIGRLAVKRLTVRRSRIDRLEIDELTVRRLQVDDVVVTKRCVMPDNNADSA
jgi:hypothetical protein